MKTIYCTGFIFFSGLFLAYIDHPASTNSPAVSSTGYQEQDDQDPQSDIRAKARQLFMRGKLSSNQKIVERLATNNFQMIAEGANSIKLLVKGQHWFVLDTPEYSRFSTDMELAATQLHNAAVAKNMEGAALRYFDMTLNCIDCHRYIETRQF